VADLAAAFPQLEILELIGQGGMGFVYKARQPRLERLVALKILPQSAVTDPRFAERFTREGRVLARLNHPNIVTIHDFGQANGFFYLLMEYVDGVNLRQAMRAGRFTPEQALAVVPKICDALQFAHNEGILHRDIKPENILLDSKGRVKIADFGIAKLIGEPQADAHLTASGGTLGTPHYMAPEQVEKPATVDHRADIYSLGVVFYEMLTGELPLGKFQPPSQKVQVDVRLDDVVLHALEKEPGRRYQHASEVKTAVDTISASPASATLPPPFAPALRRKAGLAFKAGIAAFVLTFLASLLFTLSAARTHTGGWIFLATVVGIVFGTLTLIFAGLFSAWRSLGAPSVSAHKPDLFWRRFAVGATAFILALILIPMATIFLAMLLPAFMRARDARSQADHAQKAAKENAATLQRHEAKVLGIVTDFETRKPIPGVRVADELVRNQVTVQEVITDSAGRFEIKLNAFQPHHLIASAPEYETNVSNAVPDFFTNKFEQRIDIQLRPIRPVQTREEDFGRRLRANQNSLPNTPAPKLFLNPEQFTRSNPEPNQLDWGFKLFVPPNHLASILFVTWSNGVPTVDPGFSTYFKVGKAGGVDIPFCSVACYRVAESKAISKLSEVEQPRAMAAWGYPESAGLSNAVRWDVNLGAGATGSRWTPMPPYYRIPDRIRPPIEPGGQMIVPLISFRQSGEGSNMARSGVDLRIFLEPLESPPIRSLPNEKDMTNYVAGQGLPWSTEEALRKIGGVPRATAAGSSGAQNIAPGDTETNQDFQISTDSATANAAPRPQTSILRSIQLQEARQALNESLLKYIEPHPFVTFLRKRINQLETGTAPPIQTNFFIGKTSFPYGDSITIDSVERDSGQMLVKGRYELVSADRASLALYVTQRTSSSRLDDAREKMSISKGSGRFALYHPVVVAGLPNLSMYSSNLTALAQVYFGNEREAAQEKDLVLDKE
jgi:predicted Ser/Thr protein kinase